MKSRDDAPATLDASLRSLTRESIEEAEAIAEAAEEALEADESFLAVRIRRAKEWEEELKKSAKAATHA